MKTEIINQLENILTETTQLLDSFSQADINTVPFKDSWTAAQVGCHLLKSETGIDGLFYTPTKKADRKPDENIDELKKIFLDYSLKFKSPDFILPEDKIYDKEELIGSLKEVKTKITEAAKNADLDEIAPLPQGHPFEGYTKLEMVHFLAYHTTRHNLQIQNIKKMI
ncbi:DinB family protein [Flavobacterium alkalisoli]|uniref:DinB family protein n=1 Tax=Flavobacterium alkalisoli TaxID=2602769 RepID=UPI003A92AA9C